MMPRSPQVAWVIWAVTFVLWLMTMVLIGLPRSIPGERLFALLRIAGSVFVLSTATTGALVASQRPKNPIGWIFCAAALAWIGAALAQEYALFAMEEPGSLPAGELLAWLSVWLFVPSGLAIVFLLLLFPNGQLPSSRWRTVGWAAVVAIVALTVGKAFAPGPLDTGMLHLPRNPFGVENVPQVAAVGSLGFYLTLACASLAATSLIARLRRARSVERQQLKWFAFSGAFAVLGVSLAFVEFALPMSSRMAHVLAATGVLSLAAVPVATGVSILRYRLYDIDVVINRTLVYGSVTAMLAGLFAVLSILSQRVVLAVTGQDSQAAVVFAALFVTALFQPLRARMQTLVDRRFYRRKYDAQRTLASFSATVRDEVELDDLAARLVDVARETVQPTLAFLWLRPTAKKSLETMSRDVFRNDPGTIDG